MNFLALVTGYDEKEEVIQASILDPRPLRGTSINFHSSKVQKEEKWQRPFLGKTTLLLGEFGTGDELLDVKFLPKQQFRGIIQGWDPVHMRATVEYPEIQEFHSHNFNTPWLSRGDRIIVEGNLSGLEWSVEDFELHRRVRTCRLETGTISSLQGEYGYVKIPSYDEVEFEFRDVLLCDCRDFYPKCLHLMGYDADLRDTFEVGEQVFFIRAQDENLDRCTIKVFVPGTEFGLLDPIFDPTSSDLRLSPAKKTDSRRPSIRSSCDQSVYEETSFPCCRSRTNLRDSPIMKSCPDINAYFTR